MSINQQKKQLVVELQQLEQLLAEDLLASAYKDSQDFNVVMINETTVAEFSSYYKRVLSVFRQVLDSNSCALLPFQYNFHNEYGAGNLQSDLGHLRSFVANGDFVNAEPFLLRLVYYLMQNDLWKIASSRPNKENYHKLINNAELITSKAKLNQVDTKKLLEQIEAEKENLTSFISNKNKELEQITSLLQAARNNSDEIQVLRTTSTDNNQAIIGLLNQQGSNLEESQKKLSAVNGEFQATVKHFDDLSSRFESEIQSSNAKNTDFEKLLFSVAEKSKTFEDRLVVLNEIIGKEGAVKLFQTFNDRKKELQKPVTRWTWLVFGTSVAALVVIAAIFTNLFGRVGGMPDITDWHFLVVNSIKSLPVMAVLAFAIRQYVRERNFQEEYAFRSAIALTVQAYGDIAGAKKEELVMQAVGNIYSFPSIMQERNDGIFHLKGRQINATLKEISETVKALKSEYK